MRKAKTVFLSISREQDHAHGHPKGDILKTFLRLITELSQENVFETLLVHIESMGGQNGTRERKGEKRGVGMLESRTLP